MPCSLILGHSVLLLSTREDGVEFTINRLERVVDRDGENARYMVFTPNETFENTDAFVYSKFNSSDIYGNMKEGVRYKATVAGMRVPLLNWHRNIISVEKIDPLNPMVK